jgi:osmotically inducible protein OsmC
MFGAGVAATHLYIDAGYLLAEYVTQMELFFGEGAALNLEAVRDNAHANKVYYYECVDEIPRAGESVAQLERRVAAQEAELTRIRRLPRFHVREGVVKADLSVPKEMGGPGRPGTATPEHLFAAGYAACFGGSLDFVAKQKKRDAAKAKITCAVTIGPRQGGGFGLAVTMRVEDKSLAQAELAAFVREAHEKACPYSHATRNNVDVAFEVIGS